MKKNPETIWFCPRLSQHDCFIELAICVVRLLEFWEIDEYRHTRIPRSWTSTGRQPEHDQAWSNNLFQSLWEIWKVNWLSRLTYCPTFSVETSFSTPNRGIVVPHPTTTFPISILPQRVGPQYPAKATSEPEHKIKISGLPGAWPVSPRGQLQL